MILNDLPILTIDSTTTDNHQGTLGIGTSNLDNSTRAYKKLYSDQVEEAFGLFGNSIDTVNTVARISCSNCDHRSWDEDEFFSNYDTRDRSVDDVANSNCDTCLVESLKLGGMNSNFISLVVLTMLIHISHYILRLMILIYVQFKIIPVRI